MDEPRGQASDGFVAVEGVCGTTRRLWRRGRGLRESQQTSSDCEFVATHLGHDLEIPPLLLLLVLLLLLIFWNKVNIFRIFLDQVSFQDLDINILLLLIITIFFRALFFIVFFS